MSISQDVQYCCRLDDLLQASVEQEPVPRDGAVAEQQPLSVANAYTKYQCSELRQPQLIHVRLNDLDFVLKSRWSHGYLAASGAGPTIM